MKCYSRKRYRQWGLGHCQSKRGSIETKALVIKRLQPLKVNGQLVHTVGLPRHGSHNALTRKLLVTCSPRKWGCKYTGA